MLTPFFQLTQTETDVIILIRAPYSNLQEIDFLASGTEFWFHSSPYYLRLNLPGEVVEEINPGMVFDANKCEFEITLRKKTPGESFPDLDLIGKLLAPKKERIKIQPNIEVLKSDDVEDENDEDSESSDEWFLEQTGLVDEHMFSGNLPSYGFANKVQGVFVKTKDEFKVIVDLPDPDSTAACEREELRLKCEEIAFSSHHYCADFMEEDVVEPYLQFNSKFQSREQVTLNHEEQEKLLSFGNKEYLLNKEEKKIALLSLVDILFAYSYNHRTTCGEDSSEDSSECAWTVNKLSATLCWFQYFKTINDVIKTCIRRSLCYPLYRNFKLSLKVLEDTTNILKGGRKQIIKCLLHIHKLFNESEPMYILNELYIKDYCIWVQKLSDSRIEHLIESIQKVVINKCDLNLELEELETAAILVQKDADEERLLQQVMNLDIHSKNSSDEEDESSSNESDYETDSESSSETETESFDSDDESSVSDT